MPWRPRNAAQPVGRVNPLLRFRALAHLPSPEALAFPLSPAKAQCLGVDLGFGCAGLGVGSWYTHPYYYGYPTYYRPTYYGPTYYGYPYYGYPAYSCPSYSYHYQSYY